MPRLVVPLPPWSRICYPLLRILAPYRVRTPYRTLFSCVRQHHGGGNWPPQLRMYGRTVARLLSERLVGVVAG